VVYSVPEFRNCCSAKTTTTGAQGHTHCHFSLQFPSFCTNLMLLYTSFLMPFVNNVFGWTRSRDS